MYRPKILRRPLRAAFLASLAVTSACTAVLGGFDFDGPSTSTGGTGGAGASTSSSSTSTSSSTSSSGTGGSPGCLAGATQTCYDGPAGTADVGICKSGSQVCDNGAWGPCMGAVKPATEDCAQPQDEDCDGYACSETVWAALYGDSGSSSVRATASDTNGDILVIGQLDGSIKFGTTSLIASGPYDIYLARLDKDGKALWAKQYGSPSGQRIPFGVRVDPSGNIIIAGYFSGTMIFGNTMLISSDRDVFVAKLGADGTPLWAKQFGSAMGDQEAYALAVDGSGNIALGGYFADKLSFGCTQVLDASTSFISGFLAKLDQNGDCIWNAQMGGQFGQMNAVAFDAAGNLVAAGDAFTGSNYDWMVARYDSVGNLSWSQTMGSVDADDHAKGIAVDSTGSVYVVGDFQNTFFVQADPAKNLISAGQQDVALVKLQATNGAPVWTKRFGDAGSQAGLGVAVDKHDGVSITGNFGGSISFGGPTHMETGGSADAFLAKFHADGTFVWSKSYGGSKLDAIQSVSISLDDTILFGESAYGPTIDLGTGPLTVAGTTAAALAKVAP